MNTPRVEVDLAKIRHNTQSLAKRLNPRGIAVTGVTKAVCGNADIAQAMLDGGAAGLADARVSHVKKLRNAGIKGSVTMLRTPMLSELEQIVLGCETSYNTELAVIAGLAAAAVQAKTVHKVILMVEMGDMREGVMPDQLAVIAHEVDRMPGVELKGIGANFACLNNVAPDVSKMADLSKLAKTIESKRGAPLEIVSGGNSANLPWALAQSDVGRVNDLRLGEAILLGVDPISGEHINGLYADAFTLVAEVIETRLTPEPVSNADLSMAALCLVPHDALIGRSILALGLQDTDPTGLTMPARCQFVGATSDHTVITGLKPHPKVGAEVKFRMNYGALMRAMAAPDISVTLLDEIQLLKSAPKKRSRASLALV